MSMRSRLALLPTARHMVVQLLHTTAPELTDARGAPLEELQTLFKTVTLQP